MENEPKRISRKGAKKQFATVGLSLIFYIIAVLGLPELLKLYFESYGFFFVYDDNTMIVIFYALLLFGTLLPFGFIGLSFKTRLTDFFGKARITTKGLWLEFFVFFTVSSIAIFIAEGIANYFGMTVSLIFNIGSVVTETYFDNYLYIFIFIFASPIVEEIAFRGFLQRSLCRFGKKFALFVTSVIFALAHGNFVEMIPAFIMSLMLGMISYKYRSIQPCIFVRILFNLIIYGLCYVPEDYYIYSVGVLLVIYAIAIIAIIRQKYRFVTFSHRHQPWSITTAFLTTPSIILAIVLFIADSVLLELFL